MQYTKTKKKKKKSLCALIGRIDFFRNMILFNFIRRCPYRDIKTFIEQYFFKIDTSNKNHRFFKDL